MLHLEETVEAAATSQSSGKGGEEPALGSFPSSVAVREVTLRLLLVLHALLLLRRRKALLRVSLLRIFLLRVTLLLRWEVAAVLLVVLRRALVGRR